MDSTSKSHEPMITTHGIYCRHCGLNLKDISRTDTCAGAPTMSDPVTLTTERKSTHGDWMQQSRCGNELKGVLRGISNWNDLLPHQQEALDMIATKMSRIVCGNPNEPDHWDDIAGYAHLGKGGHQA